jgi:hypothetical protein
MVSISAVACILGLWLLWDSNKTEDEAQATEEILLRMSFAYWLVYCVAFGIEKMLVPHWEGLAMSLRITTALSYFLTFSCVLSLPLYKFAVHEVEE